MGGDAVGNKLASQMAGMNMVRNFSYQVAMYQASVDKWGIDSQTVIAPQGLAVSMEHGIQNIEKGIDMEPGLPVDQPAQIYLDQLRRIEPLLTELSDFYHVEGGVKSNGVARARSLHKRMKEAWPPYQRAFEEFQTTLLRNYRRYLKQNLSRFDDDPYMKQATAILLDAVEIATAVEKRPGAPSVADRAGSMKKKIDRLRSYQRAHERELQNRFDYAMHAQLAPSALDFLKSLREYRDKLREPSGPADWVPRGNTGFLQQSLYSLMSRYNQLLRQNG